MRRDRVYFLQRKPSGERWSTLEQAKSFPLLRSTIATNMGESDDAEIRVVMGRYNENTGNWDYEQIFYIDRSLADLAAMDIGIDEDDATIGSGDGGGTTMSWASEDDGGDFDREAAIARIRGGDGDGDGTPKSTSELLSQYRNAVGEDDPSDDQDAAEDDVPWMRSRSQADGQSEDLPPPYAFKPKRRRIWPIILVIVFILLLGGIGAAGGLLFIGNKTAVSLADKAGLGAVTKLIKGLSGDKMESSETSSMMKDEEKKDDMMKDDKMEAPKSTPSDTMASSTPTPAPAPTPTEARVEPLTTGQVSVFPGIAPGLVGRWSATDCQTSYLQFDKSDYRRAIGGQEAAAGVLVTETQEDAYQYYLRRSPGMVEHFEKLGSDAIRMAGVTTQQGFLEAGAQSVLLNRCP